MALVTDYCEDKLLTKPRATPELPEHGFSSYATWGFFGTMKSGKTYNTVKVLKEKLKEKQTRRVFLISPNFGHEKIWKEIPIYKATNDFDLCNEFIDNIMRFCKCEYELWEAIQKYYTYEEFEYELEQSQKDEYFKHIGHSGVNYKFIEEVKSITEAVLLFSNGDPDWYLTAPCSSLVLDDCVNSKVLSYSVKVSVFNTLFYRHRHCALDIYILVQTLKKSLPKQVRENTKIWVVWPYKDTSLIESFYEECASFVCTKKEFKKVLQAVNTLKDKDENHRFVIFDSATPNAPLRLGFNIICQNAKELLDYINVVYPGANSESTKSDELSGVSGTSSTGSSDNDRSTDDEICDTKRPDFFPRHKRDRLSTHKKSKSTNNNGSYIKSRDTKRKRIVPLSRRKTRS